MSDNINNEKQEINGEVKMIRDLRKRIYGGKDAGPEFPISNQHCIFCAAKENLILYKGFYVCEKCLHDIKS